MERKFSKLIDPHFIPLVKRRNLISGGIVILTERFLSFQ